MATIAKVPPKSGHAWKAIVKAKGRILTTKTFSTKTAAKAWAKRIEADREMVKALGSKGHGVTLTALADQYMAAWSGKDPSHSARLGWWIDRLGSFQGNRIKQCLYTSSIDILRGSAEADYAL